MRKVVVILLITLLACAFGACGKTNADDEKIKNVKDSKVSITLSNGEIRNGTYTGEMVAGIMNGAGAFATENSGGVKWTYEGQFVDGNFKGTGTVVWENGSSREEGEFDKELLNGVGKIYQNDVLVYEGDFKDGVLNGKGTMHDKDGLVIYQGDFEMGRSTVTQQVLMIQPSF